MKSYPKRQLTEQPVTPRVVLNLSCVVPDGETVRDLQERFEKFFSYYHPAYQAQVTIDPSNPAPVLPVESDELSAEECALLGIDQADLDLLG